MTSPVVGDRASHKGFAQPPSLVDSAADALRRMIIGGDLMPGDRVVENQLTKEFGISRPPLREALRVLETEGLIRQQPRRGAIVTPLTLHDVYEIFTLRWEYERLAMRLALPVARSAELDRVHAAIDGMRRAAGSGDEAEYGRQSFEFHLSLVALSGHHRLEEA
jgi:DNA-binding GntR family transcriptional regulator